MATDILSITLRALNVAATATTRDGIACIDATTAAVQLVTPSKTTAQCLDALADAKKMLLARLWQ